MAGLALADKLRYQAILANLAPLGGLFPSLRADHYAILAAHGIDVDASYRALLVEVMVKPPPRILHDLAGIDAPNEQQIVAGLRWPPR